MKKPSSSKKTAKKKTDKKAESGELRKPAKLKPLKEKDKKNWKNTLEEEDEEFDMAEDQDLKFDDIGSIDEEEDEFFEDDRF